MHANPPGQRPLCVAIEGLDGCGKSTLARLLAEELDAELLTSSDAVTPEIRSRCDAIHGREGLTRQLFYAYAVSLVSDRARHARARGRSVVIDRYWCSTIAYPRALEGRVLTLSEVEAALLRPDLTVFVDVDLETRKARMRGRDSRPTDIDLASLDHDISLRTAFRQTLASIPIVGRLLEVQGARPIQDLVREIAGALGSLGARRPGGGAP